MEQQVIAIRVGYRFQSVILDGNTVVLPLLFGLEMTQIPSHFMTL